jgi:hypothetical protein
MLREEHRVYVFESRVLWKISGPNGDKATRKWRRLHNYELYDVIF